MSENTNITPVPTPDTSTEPQSARASATSDGPSEKTVDAPLGEPGKKALDSERAARRAAEKAAADLQAKVKEYEDRNKTELERLTEAATAAKAEADAAKAEALRLRVAAETGLPTDLFEFLAGDDEEQLRAKAQKLMAATAAAAAPRSPAPDPSQGAKPGATADGQLTRDDLARMSPTEIVAAQDAGRFADLLAGRN